MYEISYGNKYETTKNLDIKDVAKLVRKDIKAKHPGIKTSVRIRRFAGGQSLDVRIKSMANGVSPHTPEFLEAQAARDWNRVVDMRRYTEEATALLRGLESIVESYNYDGCETQVDYYNVRYYSNVSFE